MNTGRYPDWFHTGHQAMTEPYPDLQIEALVALIKYLQTQPGGLEKVAGHEDLDTGMIASQDSLDTVIRRKLDPGPMFPWPVLMDNISLRRFFTDKR